MFNKAFSKCLIMFLIYITLIKNIVLVKVKRRRKTKLNRNKINYFNIYNERTINQNFVNEFNYKTKVIASFTSYKNRLISNETNKMVNSLINQTIKPFKIILICAKFFNTIYSK